MDDLRERNDMTDVRIFKHTAEGCEPGDCKCDAPFVCPWCGHDEPTSWLLANNHWVQVDREFPDHPQGFYWPWAKGMCIAQQLTRNQFSYSVKEVNALAAARPKGKRALQALASARELLESMRARAVDVGIDVSSIEAELATVERCPKCAKGEHDACQEETMWSDLSESMADCGCWKGGHRDAT